MLELSQVEYGCGIYQCLHTEEPEGTLGSQFLQAQVAEARGK